MSKPTKEATEVERLEAEVRRHNRLYWDLASPEISDVDYDKLVRRLKVRELVIP